MGDAVLSAFLQVLFQSFSDFVRNELHLERRVEKERESLISNLDMIQAILRGAEKTIEFSDESQVLLFAKLKDASYYGMEVLDEYFYEVQRRQVIHFAGPMYSSFSLSRMKFRHQIEEKIRDFSGKIDSMKNLREMYLAFQVYVQQGHRSEHNEGVPDASTSQLPPTIDVRGRENDCQKIVHMLRQHDMKLNVQVLPILGEAFIGKTTVAQLVLKMKPVSTYFELKLWAHVSPIFDIERITSSIIESIEGFPFHCDNLNTLQMRLEKLLRGRRYLLVLDDYWSENWQQWDKLKRSLVSGAPGSKIIVTTRSEKVARDLGTLAPYKLQHLQADDCWSLFCQYAQGTKSNPHNWGDIQDIR
jgi:structure-specific endonuclease subunit SLX1